MRYSKNAKNAEHLGLRFSISFFRMKDELAANIQNRNGFSMDRVQIADTSDITFTI